MKRLIKFAIVGGSGVIVNLGVFTLAKMLYYGLAGQSSGTLLASSLTGDEISILWNFFLNNNWTFRNSKKKQQLSRKIAKFHLVAIASVIINNSILFLLHRYFGVWDVLAKFVGIMVAFIFNYLFNVKWTWRE